VWNIARFVLGKIGEAPIAPVKAVHKDDKLILKKLASAKKSIEKDLAAYQCGQALHTLYDFIWHDFADVYIETTKQRTDADAVKVLGYVLLQILILLHPFMPHLTETLYQSLPHKNAKYLIIEEW
ncbi:MAG TPA: class I tRNA ligase family protein, partial [Candidatus Paceibacterota bacterium]